MAGLVVTLDESEVRGVFPDREAGTRGSPRLHRFGVRTFAGADPLGIDFVTVRQLEEAAKTYAVTMLTMLT